MAPVFFDRKEMLLVYNDVITSDQCRMLIDEFDTSHDKKILHKIDAFFEDRVLFLQRMTPDVQSFTARLAIEIGTLLNHHFRTTLYPETVSIVRWSAGQEMGLHQDGQNPHTINRTHAVVLYLNEQEIGGEIVFPTLGTTVKPRLAGMVAYDKTLVHGVLPVVAPRYTLTLWYSDKAECSIIQTP